MKPLTQSRALFLSALCIATATFSPRSQAVTTTQPESFSGMYSPTTFTQYDGVAIYGSLNSGSFSSQTLPVFSSVTLNTTANLGPVVVQVPIGATNLHVAVFSLYGGPTSSTVTLTLDPTYAGTILGNGTSFSTAFGGTSEATIASYIQLAAGGNPPAALTTFFNTYAADFPAVSVTNTASGTIVTFSNAAMGGSAALVLAPVPEPSAWALLGLGGVTLLGMTLRRRVTRM